MTDDIYFKEVVNPLRRLEDAGKGNVFNVSENVYGFRTKNTPNILITACHHAPEIYGTFEAVLKLLGNTEENITAVPVVDVQNFKHYKNHSDKILKEYQGTGWEVCFVSDFIRGYKGKKPKRMEWQYGKEKPEEPIAEISSIIDRSDLVIDIHNSFMDKYTLITGQDNRSEDYFLNDIAGYLDQKGQLYDGNLNVSFNEISKGLFESKLENTILSYAASKGVKNLAFEIPVYDGKELYDFKKLTDQTYKLLEYTIKRFNEN